MGPFADRCAGTSTEATTGKGGQVSEREEKRARNDRMRAEMDGLLESFEQQRAQLGELQARLAATTVSVWSADNMVRIDSNVAGIPVDVHIDAGAFKRTTPDKLARSVLEAVHAAARQAGDATQQAMAPLEAEVGAMPDLSELIPGAPSIRDMVSSFSEPPPATPPQATPELTDEEEDEYFRNRSYLDPGR